MDNKQLLSRLDVLEAHCSILMEEIRKTKKEVPSDAKPAKSNYSAAVARALAGREAFINKKTKRA